MLQLKMENFEGIINYEWFNYQRRNQNENIPVLCYLTFHPVKYIVPMLKIYTIIGISMGYLWDIHTLFMG